MKEILLWKGFHGDLPLSQSIGRALEGEFLLILCPTILPDFDFLDALPSGPIRCIGEGWEEGMQEALAARARARSSFDAFPAPPCLGLFTSGSTGRPRLILYSRENLLSSLEAVYSLFDHKKIDSIFVYPQPFHIFGLALGYIAAQIYGWRLITVPGKYSQNFHRAWLNARSPGLLTLATPTHMADLLGIVRAEKIPPQPTYSAILGGASVERKLWLALRDELGIEAPSIGYGASEASPGVTHLAPGIEPRKDGEIGKPLPHLVVGLEKGAGIRIQGPSLCLAIVENGRAEFPNSYLIPDLVSDAGDGTFIFTGRANLILNRGGVKQSLEEIETALLNNFSARSICVALEHPRLGEELGIVLDNPDLTREQVRAFLRTKFGSSFEDLTILKLPSLPLNASLKLDRVAALSLFKVARY